MSTDPDEDHASIDEPVTICLVHGAFHGAWCWDLLVPELEARNLQVVVPELPAGDSTAGASACADVVVAALAGIEGDVVLVGHSLGGLTAQVVADRRPVARLIYLTSLPSLPGHSLDETMAHFEIAVTATFTPVDQGDGTIWPREGSAQPMFFHDVPDDLARWAVGNLRCQSRLPLVETSPLAEFPDVPVTFVVCSDDRVLPLDGLHRVAAYMGAPVVELPGSHSPFLSRPVELADALVGLCGTGAR